MIIKNTSLKKAAIQDLLVKNGLMQIYPLKNDKLVVKQTDTVQVTLQKIGNQIKIESKFPTIGNPVQIVVTVLFIAFFIAINEIIDVPFSWLISIAIGQGASYLWFSPKIKALKNQVFSILSAPND